MGYWKKVGQDKEADYESARDLLCEAEALEECENHPGTFFEGSEPIESAYKLANAKITSGELELDEGQSRTDITDLLQSVYQDNAGLDGCPECERNFGPD